MAATASHKSDDFTKAAAAALRALAVIKALKPQPGDADTMVCPLCGGTLPWWTVGLRCHVRAKCETAGCLEFLE